MPPRPFRVVEDFNPGELRNFKGEWTGGAVRSIASMIAPASASRPRVLSGAAARYEGGVARMSPDTTRRLQGVFTKGERAARSAEQPDSDLDRLYGRATLQQHAFEGIMTKVGRLLGAPVHKDFEQAKTAISGGTDKSHVVIGALKSRGRAETKVRDEYGGDTRRITDLVRGTVVVPHVDDLAHAVETVRKALPSGWSIVKTKNRYVPAERDDKTNIGPLSSGYRDISILLKAPNGFMHELQFNTSHMWIAKEMQGGHALYEERRKIVDAAKGSLKRLSRQERYRIQELDRRGRELYTPAMIRSTRLARRIR